MPSPELFFDTLFAPQRTGGRQGRDSRVCPERRPDHAASRGHVQPDDAGQHPAGDAYTLHELRAMLSEAGFTDVSAHPWPLLQTIVVATR